VTAADVHRSTVRYPGGLTIRFRWAGTGYAADVFALSEAGGRLDDHGPLVSLDPDRLCRAEMRVEAPTGSWAARFASPIFDGPTAFFWDVPSLLVAKFGFRSYGLDARTGELRWSREAGAPIIDVLGSSRVGHVLVQSEIDTVALEADGTVVWRLAHSDVVTGAELIGGRLVLTSYTGQISKFDPRTGGAL
jgi:outer membrane protein assembly factor BamB